MPDVEADGPDADRRMPGSSRHAVRMPEVEEAGVGEAGGGRNGAGGGLLQVRRLYIYI
jgi:hypothetical protein